MPWNNIKRLFIHLLRENAAEGLKQFTGLDLRYLDRVYTLDGAFTYGIHTLVSTHLTHLWTHISYMGRPRSLRIGQPCSRITSIMGQRLSQSVSLSHASRSGHTLL